MRWKIWCQAALTRVFCVIPVRIAYLLARAVGCVLALVPSRRRSALAENIGVVYDATTSDARVRRDVRRAFQHAMLNYVDLFRLARYDAPEIVDNIAVADWQPFEEVKARGRGVILVSAHLGNFDNVVQTLALRGNRVLVPVEPVDPPELLEAIQRQRSKLGLDIVPVGPNTFKQMAAHVRSGGTVVIVSDRDVQGTGHTVEFFGRPVRLPQAAVLLSLRTGAPVLGAFGYRHADNSITGRFVRELVFNSPVSGNVVTSAPSPRSLKASLDAGMRDLAALLECEIKRDPGQWVVQQPVFTQAPIALDSERSTRSGIPGKLRVAGIVGATMSLLWMAGRL
ncbi:MAG: putative lipid biosynthesis lauroyl acyltransferase [Chloroflexi bacterium]|nr:putative lipid biosynthesis lauroyl acyltransferase [Chloroflexota bacterium]